MSLKNYITVSKPDVPFALQFIVIWTYLNAAFNILGLWGIKHISGSEFVYLQNIFFEFIKPLLIQTLIFSVLLLAGLTFLKSKKLAVYAFVVFQFIVFNLIFLLNLKTANGIHFETTLDNFGLQYLSFNGQYLVDIVQTIKPLSGEFEGEIFKPTETFRFYFYWVILINLYFFFITLITKPVYNFFRTKSNEQRVMNKE